MSLSVRPSVGTFTLRHCTPRRSFLHGVSDARSAVIAEKLDRKLQFLSAPSIALLPNVAMRIRTPSESCVNRHGAHENRPSQSKPPCRLTPQLSRGSPRFEVRVPSTLSSLRCRRDISPSLLFWLAIIFANVLSSCAGRVSGVGLTNDCLSYKSVGEETKFAR